MIRWVVIVVLVSTLLVSAWISDRAWYTATEPAAAAESDAAEKSYADSLRSLDPALRHTERPHRWLRFHGLRLARNVPSLKKD